MGPLGHNHRSWAPGQRAQIPTAFHYLSCWPLLHPPAEAPAPGLLGASAASWLQAALPAMVPSLAPINPRQFFTRFSDLCFVFVFTLTQENAPRTASPHLLLCLWTQNWASVPPSSRSAAPALFPAAPQPLPVPRPHHAGGHPRAASGPNAGPGLQDRQGRGRRGGPETLTSARRLGAAAAIGLGEWRGASEAKRSPAARTEQWRRREPGSRRAQRGRASRTPFVRTWARIR